MFRQNFFMSFMQRAVPLNGCFINNMAKYR